MKFNKKNEYMKTSKNKSPSLSHVGFNLKIKTDELFPEITKKTNDNAETKYTNNNNKMDYLENTKKNTIGPPPTQNNLPKEVQRKEEDDFNYFEVNFKLSKMISRWDEYAKTYKMLYGDDIYDKMYVFPNYNYDYFDMLDNKYEYEQEQLDISENIDTCDDDYDTYIYVKYEI